MNRGAVTQVEFLYDFASPNCYPAYYKLRQMARTWRFEVRPVPLFLGGLFKLTNDSAAPKGSNEYNYMVKSLERVSQALRIGFNFPHSTFPVNSLKALRGSYFAESRGKAHDYVSKVFDEHYAKGTDISDPNNLERVVGSLGLNPTKFFEFIELDETKLRLRKDTDTAYERGVFGAPTYFVDGKMYWGTPEVLWFLGDQLARKEAGVQP